MLTTINYQQIASTYNDQVLINKLKYLVLHL